MNVPPLHDARRGDEVHVEIHQIKDEMHVGVYQPRHRVLTQGPVKREVLNQCRNLHIQQQHIYAVILPCKYHANVVPYTADNHNTDGVDENAGHAESAMKAFNTDDVPQPKVPVRTARAQSVGVLLLAYGHGLPTDASVAFTLKEECHLSFIGPVPAILNHALPRPVIRNLDDGRVSVYSWTTRYRKCQPPTAVASVRARFANLANPSFLVKESRLADTIRNVPTSICVSLVEFQSERLPLSTARGALAGA
mmetsp:Transcript_39178/g.54389  ORF Transcript_39178/g.54389 Transcript_39178/m.54389 type:complete len:251 (-) Transcript_39178:837-1589(-)